jgi:hypothetical protein
MGCLPRVCLRGNVFIEQLPSSESIRHSKLEKVYFLERDRWYLPRAQRGFQWRDVGQPWFNSQWYVYYKYLTRALALKIYVFCL